MSMIGKHFLDTMDKNRMLVPVEDGRSDFLCRVYTKEPKFLRQKLQRENEDGELEWVIVNHEVQTDWNFVGKAPAPKKLFFVKAEKEWDALNRIGYRQV